AGADGYVSAPPHPGNWHGWTYGGVQEFLESLASPSSLGVVVLDSTCGTVEISLVARVVDGRIQRVTTLEGLPPLPPPSLDAAFLEAFRGALRSALAPPAAALVCTRPTFDAWLYANDDKAAALRDAV